MDYWKAVAKEDRTDPTYAIISGRRFDPADLNAEELARAHGALAYIKAKIGNDGMKMLLASDIEETGKRTGEWAKASTRSKTASFHLVVPGPTAADFHAWFLDMMKQDHQLDMRAGHPDHFMNIPLEGTAHVIENVGEDDLPWYIELEFTTDQDRFPAQWDSTYTQRIGAIIYNGDRVQVGSAMHEMRDMEQGTELKFTIILPDAAPDALLDGHLRHFSVEWRNWARMARERPLKG